MRVLGGDPAEVVDKQEIRDQAIRSIRAVLQDPVAVHLNMLQGGIAKPSIENIIHLYGREALLEALTKSPPAVEADGLDE